MWSDATYRTGGIDDYIMLKWSSYVYTPNYDVYLLESSHWIDVNKSETAMLRIVPLGL